MYRSECNDIHCTVIVSKIFSSFFQQNARQFKTEICLGQLNNVHACGFMHELKQPYIMIHDKKLRTHWKQKKNH